MVRGHVTYVTPDDIIASGADDGRCHNLTNLFCRHPISEEKNEANIILKKLSRPMPIEIAIRHPHARPGPK